MTREQLIERIIKECVKEEEFFIQSDLSSPYCLDKYRLYTHPDFLKPIVRLMVERIPFNVTRLAGIKMGSVPLVTAMSLETGIPFVILREPDADSIAPQAPRILGEIHSSDRALLVDDIIATGRQSLEMARFLEGLGVKIGKICAILDREYDAKRFLLDHGYLVESLFTSSELGMR